MEINHFDISPTLKQPAVAEACCRICFDSETETHRLITPCKCNGSMRFIHEECLKIWLLSQDKDLSASECDICKSKFTMKIQVANRCSCKNYWSECLGMFIFPILLILMCAILTVILLFLVQGISSGNSSAGEQTYLFLLVIACTIIIIIISIIFIKSVKRGCCSVEMIAWSILSVTHNEVLEETIEQNGCGNVTQQPEENQVMVMPKFSRFNGRNVIRPEISTPRLMPIYKNGEVIGYKSKTPNIRSLEVSQNVSREGIRFERSAYIDCNAED